MSDLHELMEGETRSADEKDRKIEQLRRKAADAERAKRAALSDLEEANERYRVALATSQVRPIAPIVAREMGGHRPEATAVLLLSDLHVEEEVKPETVNGRNEFNPGIAESRMRSVFEGAAYWINEYSNTYYLRDMNLWLGGDVVSGYIHAELEEANAMSPVVAMMFAESLIVAGIDYLLATTELERIVVNCNHGNHDRMHMKPRVQTQAENSLSFMMYHHLASHYRDEPRVEFDIARGQHLYTEVYGRTIRWHHGDAIRYQGGVGGLTVPLRKKVDAWNTARHAHLTVIGHWHQWLDLDYAMINGSLIGWNAYAIKIGARFELPRQGFFLLDKRRWKRHVTPIYVSDHSARERANAERGAA